MPHSDSLKVTVRQLSGTDVVLKPVDADQAELTIHKHHLPKGAKVGDEFVIELIPAAEAADHRDVVARKLLEDILNGK